MYVIFEHLEKNHKNLIHLEIYDDDMQYCSNMKKNYLIVRYEDLIENSIEEFTRVAEFVGNLLNLKFTKDQIYNAINSSSFEKLKKMEDDHGFAESNVNKDGKRNKFFFLGPNNDWRKLLEKTIINDIEKKFEKEMKELKYI